MAMVAKRDNMHWPRLIKTLRAREGITQAELAVRLGVDQTAISRWERATDQPSLKLRRVLRDLYRRNLASRQDWAVRMRVQSGLQPLTLMARGAVFLEVNDAGAQEACVQREMLHGRSIYGLFGPETDDVTRRWERAGLFEGDIVLAMSVNRLAGPGNISAFIRTLDTPYFNSDGEVWCLTEIKRISGEMFEALRMQWGGDTVAVSFDTL
jgi:transcriptional regulator with XRE-family HTH domain